MWLGAALVVALGALLLALRARRRAARAEALAEALAQRVAVLEAPAAAPHATSDVPHEIDAFVITDVGATRAAHTAVPVARDIDGRLFADIVARETVVKAASWTAGLRRALAPESRNRIRFAVRQETRRAGRDRRSEMKQALREFRARERAAGSHHSGTGEDVA